MINQQTYEVEIKVLLNEEKNANELLTKLKAHDPNLKLIDQNSQLNHYFLIGNFEKLIEKMQKYLNESEFDQMQDIAFNARNHSVRTRDADGKIYFVIKAVADDTTSANGTARVEFDKQVTGLNLIELDKVLLDCDFTYQSKWSRQRQEYQYKDFHVSLDKNAGYGYLSEFEKIITDKNLIDQTKSEIRNELKNLGIEELDQARLARMFDYYNKNWPDYYGTEKTFLIY